MLLFEGLKLTVIWDVELCSVVAINQYFSAAYCLIIEAITANTMYISGDVQLSPYRIVRVIDNLGTVHVVRKDARTEFECSRQGYFRHPLGCNR
jgi:hypothetical protein